MLHFCYPDSSLPLQERKEALISRFDLFLKSEVLRDLFSLLGVDQQTFIKTYNIRQTSKGTVRELQEIKSYTSLEDLREELYPVLYELGLFSINKPHRLRNSHIIVLGGSLNACFVRTKCAGTLIDSSTRFVDGLTESSGEINRYCCLLS